MNRSKRTIRNYSIIFVVALMASGAAIADDDIHGEPLSAAKPIPIDKILASPSDYVGKTVKVEGLVTSVCPKMGCWMTLAARSDEAQEIRVKVDDGVIVFPMDATGRPAVAEGVFTERKLTLEQTVDYLEHEADEAGKSFDPASVTEPLTLYQVKAIGAVIG